MIFRFAIALALILFSLWGGYWAARAGFAGAIVRYNPQTEFLLTATRLAPDNPRTHFQLGQNFLYDPDNIYLKGAVREFGRTLELSPNHYLYWLALAKAAERAGDFATAETALARAAKLAPRYFEPRWQYANFLVRRDKFAEALPQFRAALAANRYQLGYTLELVWQISNGDLKVVESLLPADKDSQLEYLQLLLRKKRYTEVIARWQGDLNTGLNSDANLNFAHQLVRQLIEANDFALAYQIWQKLPENQSLHSQPGRFTNGDFHEPLSREESGFSWQFNTDTKAKLSIDHRAPTADGRSLRIDYASEGRENYQHLSQLIPVKPGESYRLSFAASSAEIVSGAPPFIEINNADGGALRSVIEPKLLGDNNWQRYSTQFKVPADCHAIRVRILRNAQCSTEGPCPIFGRVWFSEFQLEEAR